MSRLTGEICCGAANIQAAATEERVRLSPLLPAAQRRLLALPRLLLPPQQGGEASLHEESQR